MSPSYHRDWDPVGLIVDGLSKYAAHDGILAAALGISILALLCRLPLGLGAAGTFAQRVLAIEASEKKEAQGKDKVADNAAPVAARLD